MKRDQGYDWNQWLNALLAEFPEAELLVEAGEDERTRRVVVAAREMRAAGHTPKRIVIKHGFSSVSAATAEPVETVSLVAVRSATI